MTEQRNRDRTPPPHNRQVTPNAPQANRIRHAASMRSERNLDRHFQEAAIEAETARFDAMTINGTPSSTAPAITVLFTAPSSAPQGYNHAFNRTNRSTPGPG